MPKRYSLREKNFWKFLEDFFVQKMEGLSISEHYLQWTQQFVKQWLLTLNDLSEEGGELLNWKEVVKSYIK